MKKIIDVVCPTGHIARDVYTELNALPVCRCGEATTRLWAYVKAPGITPQGTRPEVNTDRPTLRKVDTKAIAAETKLEVEQKWLRYGDEKVAEEHVRREINHAAGISDVAGNETKIVMPDPITTRSFDAMAGAA